MKSIRHVCTATLLTVVVVGAVFTGGAAAGQQTGSAASSCPSRVSTHGDWVSIKGPVFTNAAGDEDQSIDQEIRDYAVDPTDALTIFATNSTSIMRTIDGGCHWRRVFPVGDEASPANINDRIAERSRNISALQLSASGEIWATIRCSSLPCISADGMNGGILVSRDNGNTWSRRNSGLPLLLADLQGLRVAVSDADHAYVFVQGTGTDGVNATGLYATEDGGQRWELRARRPMPGSADGIVTIDPLDPKTIWVGGSKLSRSTDGGRTWKDVLPDTSVSALTLFHAPGQPARIYGVSGSFIVASRDGGRRFTTLPAAPDGRAISIAHGSTPEDLVIATGNSVQRYVPFNEEWIVISDASDDEFDRMRVVASPSVSFFALGIKDDLVPPYYIERYVGDLPREELPDFQDFLIPTLGRAIGCPPPSDPFHWQDGWDPAPKDEGDIYVTDFYSGATIKYDRFGTGTVVAIAPQYTEGTALDPLGRIITSTRYSDVVTRLDPTNCSLVAIDRYLPTNESPTFDRYGNLFINDTNGARTYEYSWPQYPGQKPKLVFDFTASAGRGHFLEDVRVAPPGSPFAGDLFVLYLDSVRWCTVDRSHCGFTGQAGTAGNDQIAHLTRTEDGWTRAADHYDLKLVDPDFGALGMAFQPDGSLLIPDFNGTGRVVKIAPDGKSHIDFAFIEPSDGGESLVKIDITARGYVYITGNAPLANWGCGVDLSSGTPVGRTKTRLIRLDPVGNRLIPDFVHNSQGRCFVGISVPHEFAPLPEGPLPPVPLPTSFNLPPAVLAPPPQPPAPPVVPAVGFVPQPIPNLGPVPVAEPAPAPAPQMQSQGQAQAQGALVPQRQEQPQMALVHAAQRLKDQLAVEHAMVRARRTPDPLEMGKFGLGLAALSLIVAYGYVSLAAHRIRTVRISRSPRRWK